MMIKNGDLPAMPSGVLQDSYNCGEYPLHKGLSKREQFAMAAMQGLLANTTLKTHIGLAGYDSRNISECAVVMADALLAELELSK